MSLLFDRRAMIAASVTALTGCGAVSVAPRSNGSFALLDDVERRTFDFFWETGRADNGLVPDRWPTPSFCSIAAVGFALSIYPIGIERGWIRRDQAAARTVAALRFFANAPTGPEPSGKSGHKGFFYHFLDMETGLRHEQTELSSIDSTLLLLGMLFAGQYYDRDAPVEREIRTLATEIVERADWPWMQRGRAAISMGWHPESGFIKADWVGYNEGMMAVILALGATRHPVADGAWDAWTANYARFWRGEGPTRHLAFAPLFGHQYSHAWIDFRGIFDAPMRAAGFDYFENSRRATYANRAYCAANPMDWADYSDQIWGLTACDGPGRMAVERNGVKRRVTGYSARGPMGQPDGFDDGTIAPTAVMGSIPFAPEICVPVMDAMVRKYGADIYGRYGFLDSFNPSVRAAAASLDTGGIKPRAGWVATDYLGIDQGIALAMIGNYRNELIWKRMRQCPTIISGLKRAGFSGGWLG